MFSIPEVDLGVPLSWGATPRLIQEIGAARARELILMCDPIDGTRAEQLGVAHRAVPTEELDATVDAWVARIAAKPEIAVHMTKTQFRAYAYAASFGNVTETDGDVLQAASREGVARESFPRKD
jgi:enoyl-CoA hydratase/carnithine racemase